MNSEAGGRNNTCCAGCGVKEDDDIKLKDCSACYLVRYCGVDCQRKHRPHHKQECKKRAAELHDELLFKQPESSHLGDCPICFLPLPIDERKLIVSTCCYKTICKGCQRACEAEESLEERCSFCRQRIPSTDEETLRNTLKRVEMNDPVAMREYGLERYHKGDHIAAFDLWTKAAGLGEADAHFHLSIMYHRGDGVKKDKKKRIYHLEQAAIAGHPGARHNLGCIEGNDGKIDRAVKHWIIGANLGDDRSLDKLKYCYNKGDVSKEDFAGALRGHQAAVDATKSPQREAAEAYIHRKRTSRKEGFASAL